MSTRSAREGGAPRPICRRAAGIAFVLLAQALARAEDSNLVVITPARIVRQAAAHSPVLDQAREGRRVASAERRQAEAAGRPVIDARLQALRFYGLENESLGPGLTLPVIEDQYAASVGITQPLLTGGRVGSRKAATRLSEAAAGETVSATQSDVILQAFLAYWHWSKSQKLASSLQTAVARARVHLKDAIGFRQTGMATDNDVLSSEVLLDQTVLKLDEARRQVDLALARIAQLTGEELPAGCRPEEAPDTAADAVIPLDEALGLARTNRPEIAAARYAAEAARSAIRGAGAESRPQVALAARYEEGRPNLRDFPPSEEWKDNAYIGATLSWTLMDSGGARGRIAEAEARARQSAARLRQIDEQVVAQVREARINLLSARSRSQTAARAEASAAKNLAAATDLWKNGLTRHADLLDAETALTEAQYQRIAALADLAASRAMLDHATGRLRQE